MNTYAVFIARLMSNTSLQVDILMFYNLHEMNKNAGIGYEKICQQSVYVYNILV